MKRSLPKIDCLSGLSAGLIMAALLLHTPGAQASPTCRYSHLRGDNGIVRRAAFNSPMRFLKFSARGSNGRVSIGWKVTNEKDQFEYIIERSVDGVDFVPVGTLIYKATITPVNNYSFTDLVPVVNQTNYYRVRSLDVKGNSTFSPVVKVKLSTPVGSLSANPVPADESASLSLVSKSRGTVSIRILNQAGRACWHLHYSVVAGPNLLMLDGLRKLPSGNYTIQCIDGRKTKNVPLAIQH
ncbi:MAG: hypothetical protein JST39_04685 [Bacteroidetes bacterium]|nr:hypothetical protein [Bacteroidota bacterium]